MNNGICIILVAATVLFLVIELQTLKGIKIRSNSYEEMREELTQPKSGRNAGNEFQRYSMQESWRLCRLSES